MHESFKDVPEVLLEDTVIWDPDDDLCSSAADKTVVITWNNKIIFQILYVLKSKFDSHIILCESSLF